MSALNLSRNLEMLGGLQNQGLQGSFPASQMASTAGGPDAIEHQLMMHRALSNELCKQQEANYPGNVTSAAYPFPLDTSSHNNAQNKIQTEGMPFSNANAKGFEQMSMMAQDISSQVTPPYFDGNNASGNTKGSLRLQEQARNERSGLDNSNLLFNSGTQPTFDANFLSMNPSLMQRGISDPTALYGNQLSEFLASQAMNNNGAIGKATPNSIASPTGISSSTVLEQLNKRNFDQGDQLNLDAGNAQAAAARGAMHLAPDQFPPEFLQSWCANMQAQNNTR